MAAPNVPNIASGNTVFSQEMRAFHQWEANELWSAVSAFFDGRLISTTGTSTTSNTVGTGDKTFTTQSGLGYVTGMPVNVVNTANPANYMSGFVKSYSSTTLVVTVITTGGSGTLTAWSIALGLSGGGATLGTNTFTGVQNFPQGADIAAATTTNLETATGNSVVITGNTGISAWTLSNGRLRYGVITGTPLLTYHATNNNMNTGAANYQCVGGERFIAYAAGGVVYLAITKADGSAIKVATTKAALNTQITDGNVVFEQDTLTFFSSVSTTTGGTAIEFTSVIPTWANEFTVHMKGFSTNGTSPYILQVGVGGIYVTTGYESFGLNYSGASVAGASQTSGIPMINVPTAAANFGGHVTFKRTAGTNIWTAVGGIGSGSTAGGQGWGDIDAGGVLDSVRWTTVGGANTVDVNGGLSVSWRA